MSPDIISIDLGQGYSATVNSDTFHRLKLGRFKWKPQIHKRANKVYAQASGTTLHRYILGAKQGEMVDHRDGDGLNNRDHNLRLATPGQNRANSKKTCKNNEGFKGVVWVWQCRKWKANIAHGGKLYYLGLFEHKERAAMAYDRAAIAIHGEYAGLNFPERRDSYRPRDPRVSR